MNININYGTDLELWDILPSIKLAINTEKGNMLEIGWLCFFAVFYFD